MTPSSPPASGPPRLVLASASPRRRRLLCQAGVPFTVLASRFKEGKQAGDPAAFALRAARGKAADVAARLAHPAWVLSADTLVVVGRRVFGKPRTRREARTMLRALSGREHRVLTGVVLRQAPAGRAWAWVETTRVHMRRIAPGELERYLDTGEWHDKAGGYGIQERAGAFVTGIRGCYFNVVGLPLGAVCARLAKINKV